MFPFCFPLGTTLLRSSVWKPGGPSIQRRTLVILTFFLSVTAFATNARPSDPVLGKWIGEIADPQDRITIGFEFTADGKGAVVPHLYEPVLNLFGTPLTLQRAGNVYTIPEAGLELTLDGDSLSGTFSSLRYRIDLHRTSVLPHDPPVPDLLKGPAPLWSTRLGGNVYGAVTVADGVAYIGTTAGVLNAVNVTDGSFAWTFNAGRPIHGQALVFGDSVYFVCDNGYLFKLDRSNGKELWRYDLGDGLVERILPHQAGEGWDFIAPRPAIADGVIYAGSGDGSMHALDAGSGKRIWRFASKGKIRSDALVDGDRLYFGSLDGSVYALDRKHGAELWHYDTKAPVTSSPAMVDGKVIVGNRGFGIAALNAADGSVAWRALYWGSWVESSAVAWGKVFYIGASDLRRVTCYDPADGSVVWRTDVFGWNWGRPAVTEKMIYVGVAGGSPYMIRHVPSLTALDRKTGAIVWRWVPPASESYQAGFAAGPAIGGTSLVIASIDGTLYSFPLSAT
ncbi:MAG: PQQ-binding-like beta-propeller repeat protein [Acidobacteriota bacterium]